MEIDCTRLAPLGSVFYAYNHICHLKYQSHRFIKRKIGWNPMPEGGCGDKYDFNHIAGRSTSYIAAYYPDIFTYKPLK
jgi:hypothetical protein